MDKYILVEYLSTLNTVISNTFKSTQRIKITSFDVSTNYIIFGASSGGIYIFKRNPCEFLKLIPSKEGSALKIVISQNEKHLAIASSRGLVLILENFLVDINLRPQVYSDHNGNIITAIRWHGDDIYCGDNIGKVSVISPTNLLVKAIFQTPSAVLMQLDSCIVQLDNYTNYMLISTLSRTYLCNIEKEQYKQIGKKIRDGYFGSCFFNVNNRDSSESPQIYNSRGIFKTLTEDENLSTNHCSDVKIYCARPGARLWEADFDASVVVTYQFRNSLDKCSSEILHISDDTETKLNISTFEDSNKVSKSFNFGKIYTLSNRFILTYDFEGIYFFDPTTSSLILWNESFKNIKDITILNSLVFIWQNSSTINVISVPSLEELVIETLLNKQYYLCGELCATYAEDVENMVGKSKKIHLISILRSKIRDIGASDLLDKINPVLSKVEQYYKEKNAGRKLTNGIVLVENGHNPNVADCDNDYVPKTVLNFKNLYSNVGNIVGEGSNSANDKPKDILENLSINGTGDGISCKLKENPKLLTLHKQYKLNKSHRSAKLTETSNLLDKLNLDECLNVMEDFIKFVEYVDGEDATMWCKEEFLYQASQKDFNMTDIDRKTLQYLDETFVELSKSTDLSCKCNFPLPKAHEKEPRYYKLGSMILDQSENIQKYYNNIPFMYKNKLIKCSNWNDIQLNLPLITQYSDRDVIKQSKINFTYDTWDEIVKLYIKLKEGVCLNCGEKIDVNGMWTWSTLGLLMVGSIGPVNASRLLKRYSQHIPQGELHCKFYQNCILATSFDIPALATDFMEKVVDDSTSQKFEELMERFLQKKYLRNPTSPIKSASVDPVEVLKCNHCELPLNATILNETKKCNDGHNFHSICFGHISGICNICTLQT